ncbi:hypothetical protein C0J52_01174 [Blattella germanica]|nr:hypothetical protein C0J52_01174 [Blattella germanica]
MNAANYIEIKEYSWQLAILFVALKFIIAVVKSRAFYRTVKVNIKINLLKTSLTVETAAKLARWVIWRLHNLAPQIL